MANNTQNPAVENANARNAILYGDPVNNLPAAVAVRQLTPSVVSQDPNINAVYTIKPQMTGLITSFWIKATATINNSSTTTPFTLTNLGLANLFSNITLIDPLNFERINTHPRHLLFVDDLRNRKPAGQDYALAAYGTGNPASAFGYGNNYAKVVAPSSIAVSDSATVSLYIRIPLRYDTTTLRGAIFANIINQTMQIQLTANPNALTSGTNPEAVYNGSSGSISNITLELYQEYLDQLPAAAGLPMMDLQYIYEFKASQMSSLVSGADNMLAYPSNRTFLSTMLIYNNNGVYNAGSDINWFKIVGANTYQFEFVKPDFLSLLVAREMGLDLPAGVYYIDTRKQPIATNVSGNISLDINPSNVGSASGSIIWTYFEDLAMQNLVNTAPSITNQG